MAEAIGLALLGAEIGGATIVGSVTAAQVVGSVALIGASVGANALATSLTEQRPRREAQQAVLNQAMGARVRGYGQFMVGGTRFFWDARNGQLFQGIVIGAGRIDSIREFWIGDRVVETSNGGQGGNVLSYPMINKVFYEVHLGDDLQEASPTLRDFYPDVWTADHRLNGLAYVVVVFQGVKREDQQLIYPQGYNTVLRFVVRGARVWDTSDAAQDPDNKATWTWSESPAHCILDYHRHADGMRLPRSRMDTSSFADFHALCSELVARRDGTQEARYRLWGTYTFDEKPKDVLARMCATCDATLVQGPTGLIGIRGGRWSSPLVNIPTEAIGPAELSQGNNKLSAYNRLKVSYTDPDNYWQATELQARDDLDVQAKLGVVDQTFDLVMVPSWTQAARLGKIRFAKDNPLWKGRLGTNLSALDALNEPTIQITYDPIPSFVGEPFLSAPAIQTGFSLRGDCSGCDLSFVSIAAAAHDWNPQTEEPPRPIKPQVIQPVNTVPPPTNVVASIERRTISGGTNAVFAVLQWEAPDRPDASPEPQYRKVGGSDADYQPMAIRAGALSAEIGPLTDGQDYDTRVRYKVGANVSDWVNGAPITAIADETAPGPPTGLAATGSAGQYSLAFTAPNAANYGSTQAYRGSTANFGSAAPVGGRFYGAGGQSFDRTDTVATGTYYLWVRAFNRSGFGDASSTAGPIMVTVT